MRVWNLYGVWLAHLSSFHARLLFRLSDRYILTHFFPLCDGLHTTLFFYLFSELDLGRLNTISFGCEIFSLLFELIAATLI